MRRSFCFVAGAMTIAAVDFLVTTLLAVYSTSSFGRFLEQLRSFSFGKSAADLWIFSLIRFSLSSGLILGTLVNGGVESAKRLKFMKRPLLYVIVCCEIYVLIKLLYAVEDLNNHLPVTYGLQFGLAFLCNLLLLVTWALVSAVTISKDMLSSLNLQENGSEGDTQRILKSSPDDSSDNASDSEDDDAEADVDFRGGSAIWKLLRFAKPDLLYIAIAFVFLLCASAAEIFLPLYTGRVIDSIVIEKSSEKFQRAILMMSIITLAAGIASGARGGLFSYIMARFTNRLQNSLFSHVLEQEIAFFDKKRTGEITSRLTSDTAKVGNEISLNINIFLRNAVKLVGVVIMMARLSWKLTIVTLVGTPIVVLIAEAYGQFYQKLSEEVQDSLAKANESAEEAISSIRTVRSFAGETCERHRYRSKLLTTFNLQKKEALFTGGYNLLSQVCDLAITVVVLFYGGHLVLRGDLSGGVLVSFILYDLELGQCIEEMGEIYTSLMDAVGAAKKVFEYMERDPKLKQTGILAPTTLCGSVEFQDVSFAYPTRADTLVNDSLSFKINPGEVVAVVGKSGGGKSTLVSLLQHFYEPQSGRILIDGRPVCDYEHHYLHQRIAMVAQEPVLFARSIAENIVYALDENSISQSEIEDAAQLANAHTFITQMPKGYETQAGEKGAQLSGGQKQRVAIARALIRKPSILILDEATSALDAHSEHLVQEALHSQLKEKTVIIIAHRLSTIEKADKVLVLDHGKLVEEGSHQSLMMRQGHYHTLVKRQLHKDVSDDCSARKRNSSVSSSASSSSVS